MPTRYRADLADVAWGKEHAYGVVPPSTELASLVTAGGTSEVGKLRGQWGLVTGGIDLPTPTFDWQPFYGLGVMNRNMLFPIQGRERLEGRISQTLLCHDASRLFLEQMMGLTFNGKNTFETYAASVGTYSPSTVSSAAAITATTATLPGGSFNGSSPTIKSSPPTHIVIVADVTGQTPDRTQDTWAYIGTGGGATVLNVFQDQALSVAGWNGVRPPSVASLKYSIHGIGQATSATGTSNQANAQFVTRDDNVNKLVMIRPTLVQPSFTLGARFRADDGSNFITNYSGCKVSRAVFNFEEGAPVNFGADFIARDMSHNIGEDALITTPEIDTIKYKAEGTAAANTVAPNYMKNIRVTEQPYFYSSVSLTFQGEAIARFRRFTITIDNGLDPRYYITQNDAASPRDNRQILHEILEGRRGISFGGSLDLDDDGHNKYPYDTGNTSVTTPTDAQFLRYLLNQGMTSIDARDMNTLKGLGITVELRKVNDFSTAGSAHDKIKFQLPSNQAATTYYGTESEVGMVLRSAPHNIPAPPSVHIPVDIDGMASSMHVEIMDGVSASD